MGINGIESGGLSEDTRRQDGQGTKERREVKHFSEGSGRDHEYGPEWGPVVDEYLKTGYKETAAESGLEVSGTTYKVLRRDKVTVFYNAEGDTLFDVTNERLEKESGSRAVVSGNAADVKERAKKKLEEELRNASDKSFADPIIKYLLGRCEEDKSLSEDVLLAHKTWKKCFDYIYSQARKRTSGNSAAVRDEVVYEWAEDYYHKDDKAEEAEKAREAEEKKRRAARTKRQAAEMAAKSKENKGKPKGENTAARKKQTPPAPAEKVEEKKLRKSGKDLEGQMDMFSMMGIKEDGLDG